MTSFCMRLLIPCIIDDSIISDFPFLNPSMDSSTSDHLQNTPNVSPSFQSGEDKFFIENPLDFSSTFSKNVEGEHSCFSSTSLFDSSYHDDADEMFDFSNRSYHDSFTLVLDHYDDSIAIHFRGHLFMMIYLTTMSKHPRLLRHFRLS